MFYHIGVHCGNFNFILQERGYENAQQLRAQCKDFNCPKTAEPEDQHCCCRRILYNEPDFQSVVSTVEQECLQQGFQCWGHAKRVYRDFPLSKSEVEMEEYVMNALSSVDVEMMRRFFNRSLRFMDAYRRGLTGTQAAWASRRYRGHRKLPDSIMRELDAMDLRPDVNA